MSASIIYSVSASDNRHNKIISGRIGSPLAALVILVSMITFHNAQSQSLNTALRIGSSGYDAGEDIVLDAAGNSYVTGRFSGTADFDPGAGVFNLTSAGGEDAFVAKYTATGQLSWAIGFGGTSGDLGHGIGLDAAGNVYVMGRFVGTVDVDPSGTFNLTSNGGLDTFVAKYTTSGTLLWAFAFGGTLDDAGEDLAVDPAGNVYLTGGIQGTVDFDPGPGVTEFTSSGDLDIFRAKYSTAGALLWAYVAPDALQDNQRGFRMVVDAAGYSYVTGWFKRNPVVGNVNGEQIISNGESDAWIGKFDSAGNNGTSGSPSPWTTPATRLAAGLSRTQSISTPAPVCSTFRGMRSTMVISPNTIHQATWCGLSC
jgi:hypothetical protein